MWRIGFLVWISCLTTFISGNYIYHYSMILLIRVHDLLLLRHHLCFSEVLHDASHDRCILENLA